MWNRVRSLLVILLFTCTAWLFNNVTMATSISYTDPSQFPNPGPTFTNGANLACGYIGSQCLLNSYTRNFVAAVISQASTLNPTNQSNYTSMSNMQKIISSFIQNLSCSGGSNPHCGGELTTATNNVNRSLSIYGQEFGILDWSINFGSTPNTLCPGSTTNYNCCTVTGNCTGGALGGDICFNLGYLKLGLDAANSNDCNDVKNYLLSFLTLYVTPLYEYYQNQVTQAAIEKELQQAQESTEAIERELQEASIAPLQHLSNVNQPTGSNLKFASTAPNSGNIIGNTIDLNQGGSPPPFDSTNCVCSFNNQINKPTCGSGSSANPFNIPNSQTYMGANNITATPGNTVLCKQISNTIINSGNTNTVTADDSCLTTAATYQRNCYNGCTNNVPTISQNVFWSISQYFSMIDHNAEGIAVPDSQINLVSPAYTQNIILPSSTEASTESSTEESTAANSYTQYISINDATNPSQTINVLNPATNMPYSDPVIITETITTDDEGNQVTKITGNQAFTRCMVPTTNACFMFYNTVCCLDPGSGIVNLNAGSDQNSALISFRAVYIGNDVCIETLLPSGFEVIGCKSRYVATNGATNATTTTTMCYVANACISTNMSSSLAPIPVTSLVIQCVKETLDNLFSNPTACPASAFLLPSFQQNMRSVIFMALCLYVIIFGIHVILGEEVPSGGEAFMFVFKMILVIYFSVGFPDSSGQYHDGLTFLYNALLGASADFSNMMLSAAGQICSSDGSGGSTCVNRGLCNYCLNCYDNAHKYLATWDALDCRIGYYLGAYNENQLVYALFVMIIPLVITFFIELPAILFLLFSILFSCFVIAIAISAVTIVSMSFIMIAVLIYLAPLFVPCALFKWTKSVYDQWQKLLVSYALQPVVIIGFISMMMSMFDYLVYSDCTFTPSTYVRTYVTTGSDTIKKDNGDGTSCVISTKNNSTQTMFFNINDSNASSKCQNSFGYVVNQLFADGNGIGSISAVLFSLPIITNAGQLESVIVSMPLLVIFGYVFYELMDKVAGIAGLLTEGGSLAGIAGGMLRPTAIFKGAYGAVDFAFRHSPGKIAMRGIYTRPKRLKGVAKQYGSKGSDELSMLTGDKNRVSTKDLNHIKMQEVDKRFKDYMKSNPGATRKQAMDQVEKTVSSKGMSMKDIQKDPYLNSLDQGTKERMQTRYLQNQLSTMSADVAKLQLQHAKAGTSQKQINAIKDAHKKTIRDKLEGEGYSKKQIQEMHEKLQVIRADPEKLAKVREAEKDFNKQLNQYWGKATKTKVDMKLGRTVYVNDIQQLRAGSRWKTFKDIV